VPIVIKSGSLNLVEPYVPVQACNGIVTSYTGAISCSHHSPVAGVTGSHTVVAPGASALEGIPTVHDSFARDTEVPQAVVFLFYASVGHAGNSRALLR
jgi:hypothetical protein